jgi:hypothetical protein
MRRVTFVVAALAIACCFTLSSCTAAQVKAWFWTQKHHHITNRQAQTIANLTNRPPAPAPVATTPTAPATTRAPSCDPNYTGACVPAGVSDVDCAGGDGDGPYYVTGPVYVVGTDIYGLDSNGDGVGCESG